MKTSKRIRKIHGLNQLRKVWGYYVEAKRNFPNEWKGKSFEKFIGCTMFATGSGQLILGRDA